ncbi:hypothetical protein IWQ60_005232 [Tieghemiomyces parasiticus]|uniref:UV damage endonuclease UvdE n=1 Tax=Tieghemiomyces parasiticus TaxID=78921 RepID=A0A9W8A6P4_9FUNG|nr:hypothetical protein IWQ60_005232 [Tieghemiomyces parasiticus]
MTAAPTTKAAAATDALTTDFRGRLGYACLNTVLRAQKPSVFCSRTCRLDTLKTKGLDFVRELALANVRDIIPMLEWNERNHIRFMRLSSEIFPFASHPEFGYDIEFAREDLHRAGALAKQLGHRLTFHPGQFNQLGSPTAKVINNSILELDLHARILDYMDMPVDSVMIIHMGGVYGDKAAALARFEQNFPKLSTSAQARLVLENDEICYSVADLLPICDKLSIPLVFDWHHDAINPSADSPLQHLPAIRAIWERRGIRPKQHYSESRAGAVTPMERRAHSDRVVQLPPCEPDVDLMIEAKDKEQAVFQLYRLYGLAPVNPKVVRAPAAVETLRVKDRRHGKSETSPAKKRKAKSPRKDVTTETVDVAVTKGEATGDDPAETVKTNSRSKGRARKSTTAAVAASHVAEMDEKVVATCCDDHGVIIDEDHPASTTMKATVEEKEGVTMVKAKRSGRAIEKTKRSAPKPVSPTITDSGDDGYGTLSSSSDGDGEGDAYVPRPTASRRGTARLQTSSKSATLLQMAGETPTKRTTRATRRAGRSTAA